MFISSFIVLAEILKRRKYGEITMTEVCNKWRPSPPFIANLNPFGIENSHRCNEKSIQ